MVNSKNQNIKLFLKFEVEKSNQIKYEISIETLNF